MEITYVGYDDLDDLDRAVVMYRARTGHAPTLILVRPDALYHGGGEIVVRSRFGMANGALLTHFLSPSQVDDSHPAERPNSHREPEAPIAIPSERLDDAIIPPKRRPMGRPSQKGGICPHCGNDITNFEKLGWWWGWEKGIEPPYWSALRLYIFRRDDFTCQTCGRRLSAKELVAHHIVPKEQGGIDGSRNLVTLCHPCHLDEQPIMPDSD